jgi:hypothetical protein
VPANALPAGSLTTAALPEPESSADQVQEVIDRILARPEFAPAPRSAPERGRDWVAERLDELLEAIFAAGAGSAVGWAIVALLVAITVVLAVRFSRGVRSDPVLAPMPSSGARRPATDWRTDAATHEAAGRWRAALRCWWRALVADLAGRGLVEEAPGRTAGEYRRQVATAAPAAAVDFDAATVLFEDAWYGDRPADATQAQRLRALSARVLEEAGSRK